MIRIKITVITLITALTALGAVIIQTDMENGLWILLAGAVVLLALALWDVSHSVSAPLRKFAKTALQCTHKLRHEITKRN